MPRGAVGELCTRGYAVMLGYWDDPERTAEAIDAEGWMHTGDLGTLDAEGYCNIAGRAKDMIIRGGENVYPREIEEYLFRHPKIAEVAVIGVPDAKYGEEVCAWVRLHSGQTASAEEVRGFCQGQIAHYKIPRYVHFVDAFPTTVTGKVQKFLMRQQMMQLLESHRAEHRVNAVAARWLPRTVALAVTLEHPQRSAAMRLECASGAAHQAGVQDAELRGLGEGRTRVRRAPSDPDGA